MVNLGEIIRQENERENNLSSKFIPYFKVKAYYCSTKQDSLELFFIWIINKGVSRTFDDSSEIDDFVNECIDSFCSLFISNNKFGEKILLSKAALKRFFWLQYKGQSKIYESLENEGHIVKEDNLGNRCKK